MLPFKFKQRKCEEIIFRNASAQSMNFYLRVHTNPTQLPFGDLRGSQDYFDSPPTESPTLVRNYIHNYILTKADSFLLFRTQCLLLRIRESRASRTRSIA